VLAAYQERASMRGVARIFGISRNSLAELIKKSRESS
jgi:transposase-like protein